MLTLPNDVIAYKRTPDFDRNTVPPGFLKDHSTKKGTWGVLTVELGEIHYIITEPGYEGEYILAPERPGIIAPQHTHYIRPIDDVLFYVTFHRKER